MEKVQRNSINKKQNGLKQSNYVKSSTLPRNFPLNLDKCDATYGVHRHDLAYA